MNRLISHSFLIFLCIVVSGCESLAVRGRYFWGFNTFRDSPDIEILDYRYGYIIPDRNFGPDKKREALMLQFREMVIAPEGHDCKLYMKWRVKSTGEEYEENVDLSRRLPANITAQTVYLVIEGPQLYVYLISPEERPKNWPPLGPKRYYYEKVTQLHPLPKAK